MTQIQAPTNCPSCSSLLDEVNFVLFCRSASCGAKQAKQIQHFTKTLKIKGLGEATISKLDLAGISDIYTLSKDEICTMLESTKLGEKLYAEIEISQQASLNVLLPAFSIPLIGKVASDKLSKVVEDIYSINATTCLEAGLGEKATENLLTWIEVSFPEIEHLPFSWNFTKVVQKAIKGTVCISGKLKSYKTKTDAHKDLEALGYSIKSSITKDVTILVNESGIESLKTKKARESGVTIVDNLQQFLLEN